MSRPAPWIAACLVLSACEAETRDTASTDRDGDGYDDVPDQHPRLRHQAAQSIADRRRQLGTVGLTGTT